MQSDKDSLTKLNQAWHDAYQQRQRDTLREILSEDFVAFFPDGTTVNRATLIAAEEPPDIDITSEFGEPALHVFGDTAITCGRVDLDVDGEQLSQRFMRVWNKREGRWWAVAVQVFPVEP